MEAADSARLSRRHLFLKLLGLAASAGAFAASAGEAEARRPWGPPPGWSRGRKRGWRKKGGPKWRW